MHSFTASDAVPPSPLSKPARDRLSNSSSLYSVPPLPPLPPPLPIDAMRDNSISPHSSNILVAQLGGANEQLAVLDACLASGDISRAEEVAKRIQTQHMDDLVMSDRSLAELLPPRIHSDFLRAYLQAALTQPIKKPSVSGTPVVPSRSKTRHIAKAWAHWTSLFEKQWNRPLRDERIVSSAIDAGVIAVMMKGLTAVGPEYYNPTAESDPERVLRPITALLPVMETYDIPLERVLGHSIFEVELPSYLGKVDREAVLNALIETGQGRSRFEEWEPRIEEARSFVRADEDTRQREQEEQAVAELQPTETDGVVQPALTFLRTNLSMLNIPSSRSGFTPTARQRLLEESSYDAARQLYIHELESLSKIGREKDFTLKSDWLQKVMFDWLVALEAKLKTTFEEMAKDKKANKTELLPFLRLVEPKKLALLTIIEVLRLSGLGGIQEGMKVTRAIMVVGKAVENEYHTQCLIQMRASRSRFIQELDSMAFLDSVEKSGAKSKEHLVRIFWRREMAKREQEQGSRPNIPIWSPSIRAKIGSILVTNLMAVGKVTRRARDSWTGEFVEEVQPAFSHAYQYVRGTKLGIIKINPAVAERLDIDPMRATLHPRHLPMVVKPKPWLDWDNGAYLLQRTSIVRTKDGDEQASHLKQAADANALEEVYSGLDALGSVAWRINRKVFEVATEVWNSGEELAEIPKRVPLTDPLDVDKPDNVDSDPRARVNYKVRLRKALQERREAHSSRCDINYKLEIARAFLGETFYFPHNLDFRGRAYPIPPNLSHIGNDLSRGLLRFDEAKPLGVRGLRWLKIHLANLCGYDKVSLDEREAFAMQHLDDIYDSADRPLEGNRWWLKADDPWQCLATCFELAAALRSPDPHAFLSSLPVHQDGTCNGLQHYAALGGDLSGAHQVNLDVGERPSDVYSGVAQSVNDTIDRDAANGDKVAQILQGKVNRKVVKQTVMTTVYGVTFVGAKKQIERQLRDRGDIPAEDLYKCSMYLGRLTLDAIGDLFKGASGIQLWLHRTARLIAKSIPPNRLSAAVQSYDAAKVVRAKAAARKPSSDKHKILSRIPREQMTSVICRTPLGLPVVQPYRKEKKRQVMTALQTVFISDPSIPAEVDSRAQATAFPPNFIHSLDATHMMMTALACKDRITFASVHDSYWTHASSVDEMSTLLRDAFIDLHSQDILGNLRSDFLERYKGHVVPVSRISGNLEIVLGSDGQPKKTDAARASTVDEVRSIIDTGDKDDDVSALFAAKGSRAATSSTASKESDIADSAGTNESIADEQADTVSKEALKSSNRLSSKFVFLSDVIEPVPKKGNFDLNRIRDSMYFFS